MSPPYCDYNYFPRRHIHAALLEHQQLTLTIKMKRRHERIAHPREQPHARGIFFVAMAPRNVNIKVIALSALEPALEADGRRALTYRRYEHPRPQSCY
jgi:hypothetical protein